MTRERRRRLGGSRSWWSLRPQASDASFRRLLRVAIAVGASVLGAEASAHIDLLEPVPRAQGDFRYDMDPNSNLKEGPCGQVVNGRTDRVTALRGGQQLTVRFTEWISHRSYYRVALDADGDDDFPLRGAPSVLSAEGDNPEELFPVDGVRILAFEHNDRSGGEYTVQVTVPNLSCDNCTLQLIQYMYGSQRPYYFQCADLTIEADPALPLAPDPESLPEWDLEAARNSRRDPDAGLILPPWPTSSEARDAGAGGAWLPEGSSSEPSDPDAGVVSAPMRARDTGCFVAAPEQRSGPSCLLLLALGALGVRRRKALWSSFHYAARQP